MFGKKKRGCQVASEVDVIDLEEVRRARREKRQALIDKKTEKDKDKDKESVSYRRAAKRRRFAIFCAAVILFLGGIVVNAGIKLYSLEKQKQAAQQQLVNLKLTEAELTNELSQVDSDEYVEQEARSELHMILPGEVLYVLPEDVPDGASAGDGAVPDEDDGVEAKPQ